MINNKNPHRFLIIRTDRIGDVILSTPVISALMKAFPDAFIGMLVREYTREVVDGHPGVNVILMDDAHNRKKRLWTLARELRTHRFHTALILHPTLRLAILCLLAGIPVRLGTAYRLYSFLFNKKIYRHRKKSTRHECDLNLDFAHKLGADITQAEFHIHIPDVAQQKADSFLKESGINGRKRFIIIHPGSGGSALDWPAAKFAHLVQRVTRELELHIILTGSEKEHNLVDQIAGSSPLIHRLDGQLTLKELAAIIKKAALVVANSTGPLHLAAALGTEVLGLYCPILPCRPERWGPYGKSDSVIMPPVGSCSTCRTSRCKDYNCMDQISVDQVFSLVRQKLQGV